MKSILLFIYQLVIWLPLFLIITMLTALVTIVGCLLGGEKIFSYYPGMIWSRLVCMLTLCPVRVTGREKLLPNQSYIFASNHQGAYDIFLIYGYLGVPIKWIMKKSLRKIFLVGKACESAGFIFVDTSSAKAAGQTIREAEEKLQHGASISIFPESTRSKTGRMGSFKKGAFQMALDLQLPIVPLTINGTFEVMPTKTLLIRPHRLELIIHDPIPATDEAPNDLREAAAAIRRLSDNTRAVIHSDLWEKYKDSKGEAR
ncbi:MAG: 1-acyl-sn-glycerol-3-phosphate acyltransferase [Dysgonamonadaceae bacterium]|nr:1-acyl-sn-glycerol-3-phosphate acyltransferase [Dysgonamonadaceae bacterium]